MNAMKVVIRRSARRRKTIQWRILGDEVFIYMPVGLPKAEEERLIEKIRKQAEEHKKRHRLLRQSHRALKRRAEMLNAKYFGGKLRINSIRYVNSQVHSFGSCSPNSGDIRLSHRLKDMPAWVRDYVIIHELAHLMEPNHSKRFWERVSKYRYAERARGFLIAREMEDNHPE